MSDMLRNWLAQDVGLEVQNFEQEFATGYVFGELLSRYNMLPDFDKFDPRGTPDAMINNYTRLQPSFKKLGIPFDTRTANSLMKEEPGVALRLLYSIKQSVGSLQKELTKFQHTGSLGKEYGAVTQANRGLLEAQQYNTIKEPFHNGNQRLFEESMRSIAGNNKHIMEAVHLQRFTDAGYDTDMKANNGNAAERAMLEQQAISLRSGLLNKMGTGRNDKATKLQHDDAIHSAILKRKEDLANEETRVQMTLHGKSSRKKLVEINHASLDVHNGIDAFERKLLKTPSDLGDNDGDAMISTGMSQDNRLMKTMAATTGEVVEASSEYMRAVKAQKLGDMATKKEHEARRRMMLSKMAELAAESEASMQEEALSASLARQSAQEVAICERLWQLRQEKEVMQDDRAFRETQYVQRREQDALDTLEREADLHRSLREQYDADAAAEAAAWLEAQGARSGDTARKNADMCRDIAMQLVMLAERAGKYRAENNASVSLREYRNWLAMFRSGDPALDLLAGDAAGGEVEQANEATTSPADADATTEGAKALPSGAGGVQAKEPAMGPGARANGRDVAMAEAAHGSVKEALVEDYLDCTGYFAPMRVEVEGAVVPSAVPVEEARPVGFNPALGKAVADLVGQVRDEVEAVERPSINYALRLAVLGAPFSGKTTTAQELAREFKLRLLEPEALAAEALEAAAEYKATVAAAAAAAAAAQPGPALESVAEGPEMAEVAEEGEVVEAGEGAEAEATSTAEGAEAAQGGVEGGEAAPAVASHAEAVPEGQSRKAALGLQIQESLTNGEDISDQVMVNLVILAMEEAGTLAPPKTEEPPHAGEAGSVARSVTSMTATHPVEPEPSQGFILDGFPRSVAQAQLMESILTGLDLAEEQSRVDAASRLAPPPAEALPDLSRPLRSALDAVIALDLSDETIALKRALGRRLDPETARVYHLEFDPPPADEPGLVARLKELEDPANDAVQIQRRLTGYGSQAAALESWLKRFDQVHRPLDGEKPLADVLATASECASCILGAANAAGESRSHAEAAAKGQRSAEGAQEFAELARGYAESAARELLAAKRAELAAQALLLDPKTKNPDPAATEVLKAQAAAKCTEQLKACKQAAADAANYAERAAFYTEQANEALQRALQCLAEAETSLAAQKDARSAAADAAAAHKAAAAATARSVVAREAADVAVVQAEKVLEAEAVSPEEVLELAPPAPDPASEAAAAAAAEAAVDAAIAKAVPMPKPISTSLLKEWRIIEAAYMEGLGMELSALSEERDVTYSHFEGMRVAFKSLLARPDESPAIVTQFQRDFNGVEDDTRQMAETKGELLLRAEELREQLWEVCDKKLEVAEAERKRLNSDTYVADHTALVVHCFSGLLQVELDRFASSINLSRSYVQAKYGILSEPKPEDEIIVPNALTGEVPADVKDKVEEKSKTVMQFPPQFAALQPKAPALTTSLKVAVAIAANVKARLDPSVEDPKAKKAAAKPPAKGKDAVEPAVPPVIEEAMAKELLELGAREADILEQRALLLAERAAAAIQEVASTAERTDVQIGLWIKSRFELECSAVAALDGIVKEAAFAGRPLAHDILLQNSQVIVDQTTMHVPAPAELPPTQARETTPPAGLASISQLARLVQRLVAVAPQGYIKLAEASELLCKATADGSLPESWAGTTNVAMLSMLRLYDSILSGYIDWREVVCNLLAASVPEVMQADCCVMAQQAGILAAVDADGDGFLSLEEWDKAELWFQLKQFQPGVSDADLEVEFAEVDPEAIKPKYDRTSAMKKVLWMMFNSGALPEDSPSAIVAKALPDKSPRLDYRAVLLYLSADRDFCRAVQKACSLLAVSPSLQARVSPEQVFRMAHPLGSQGGVSINRTPLDLETVTSVSKAIAATRGGDAKAPTMCAEEMLYYSAGAPLVKSILPLYHWKDGFAATRLL